MALIDTLEARLRLDVSEFESGIKRAQQEQGKLSQESHKTTSAVSMLEGGMASAGKAALGWAAGLGTAAAVFGTLSATLKTGIEEIKEAEIAGAKLAAVFAGNAEAIGRMNALVGSMNAKTPFFEDDQITQGLATLRLFDLTEAQLKELLPAVTNVATVMGTDLQTASQQLGLALMGNTRGLKALGIDMEQGASRANVLAAYLGQAAKFEESAADMAGGLSGKLAQLNKDTKDAATSIVDRFNPALQTTATLASAAMLSVADLVGALADLSNVNIPSWVAGGGHRTVKLPEAGSPAAAGVTGGLGFEPSFSGAFAGIDARIGADGRVVIGGGSTRTPAPRPTARGSGRRTAPRRGAAAPAPRRGAAAPAPDAPWNIDLAAEAAETNGFSVIGVIAAGRAAIESQKKATNDVLALQERNDQIRADEADRLARDEAKSLADLTKRLSEQADQAHADRLMQAAELAAGIAAKAIRGEKVTAGDVISGGAGLAGTAIGAMVGGPPGAALGGQIGNIVGTLGGAIADRLGAPSDKLTAAAEMQIEAATKLLRSAEQQPTAPSQELERLKSLMALSVKMSQGGDGSEAARLELMRSKEYGLGIGPGRGDESGLPKMLSSMLDTAIKNELASQTQTQAATMALEAAQQQKSASENIRNAAAADKASRFDTLADFSKKATLTGIALAGQRGQLSPEEVKRQSGRIGLESEYNAGLKTLAAEAAKSLYGPGMTITPDMMNVAQTAVNQAATGLIAGKSIDQVIAETGIGQTLQGKDESIVKAIQALLTAMENGTSSLNETISNQGTARNPLIVQPPKGGSFDFAPKSYFMRAGRGVRSGGALRRA